MDSLFTQTVQSRAGQKSRRNIPMRIQHNIMALNASNRLKSNDNAISKNIAKLSSGYRINSAADDAAGLAVSEKMRAQINGLNQAEDNAQNGVSLIQTAEGGLNETEAILQRMNTLAVESANGTYQDGTDRANLNKEVTALKSEIDRISTSTNFNQINLLDGSLGGGAVKESVATFSGMPTGALGTVTAATQESDSFAVDAATDDGTRSYTVYYTDADGKNQLANVTVGTDKTGTETAISVAADVVTALNKDSGLSSVFDITADGAGKVVFKAKEAGVGQGKIDTIVGLEADGTTALNPTITATAAADAYQAIDTSKFNVSVADQNSFSVNGQKFAFVNLGGDPTTLASDVAYVVVTGANTITKDDAASMANLVQQKTGMATSNKTPGTTTETTNIYVSGKVQSTSSDGVTFQIGSENKADQTVSLSINDMSSSGLGVSNVSIKNQGDAKVAIDTIKSAINTVSATRANLGALQNRLEHTENNLSTMSQNLTSAESNIRDVDMSDEYVQYSKNQILSQAATAMLTQANAQPQNVLSLLKG
jgi:flagellin